MEKLWSDIYNPVEPTFLWPKVLGANWHGISIDDARAAFARLANLMVEEL